MLCKAHCLHTCMQENQIYSGFLTAYFFSFCLELCGTPGYVSPEMLRAAMCEDEEDSEGYDLSVDM